MKKKSAIIIAIILMSIGFAVVSTTLIINGNAKVSENEEDFSVIFTAASLDGKNIYSSVVDDTKKTINFITPELSKEEDNTVLTYEVTNNSNQYDAKVKVTCVPKDGITAKYTSIKNKLENDATVVKAKESLKGTLTVTLDKIPTEEVTEEYTCKLEFNAVERESIGYNGPTEWTFDYTGGEQTFVAPITGIYKLEVWGAQGGYGTYGSTGTKIGGYGAYSFGNISIAKGSNIYVNIGGQGGQYDAGYNGGGKGAFARSSPEYSGGGGGATHIAKKTGILSTLENFKKDIFIVASGGGGGSTCATEEEKIVLAGGSGGGINGNSNIRKTNYGASQTSGGTILSGVGNFGTFGQGGNGFVSSLSRCESIGGGGGGYYGGASNNYSGSGGSSYIGNSLLSTKAMYCYNCEESTEISTKTISTTCTSATPTVNCSKQGNGYARITLIK